MRFIVRQQLVRICRQPEEVGLLLHPGHWCARLGGDPGAIGADGRLRFGEEPLVAHRVPARVVVQIDIAGRVHPVPDVDGGLDVVLVGSADEPVEGDVELFIKPLEYVRVTTRQLGGVDTLRGGRFGHLLAMLVGARQEADVEVVEALEPGDRVGRDLLVRVADVGCTVRVVDGCGDVVRRRSFASTLLCWRESEAPGAARPGAAGSVDRRPHPPRRLRRHRRPERPRDRGPRRGGRRAGRRHHRRRPGIGPLGDRRRRRRPPGVRGRGPAPDARQRTHRRSQGRHRTAGRPSARGGDRRDRHGHVLAGQAPRLRRACRPGRGLRLAHRLGQAHGQAADDPQPRRRRRRCSTSYAPRALRKR